MKKGMLILCIFAFQAFLIIPAFATPIYIDNYSFENPAVNVGPGWIADSTGSWTQGVGIPGWTCSDTGYSGVISGYGTAADGNNAAWVQYDNYISQSLTATLQPNSLYTLSVAVGNRVDWDKLNPEIQLLAGGNVLSDKTLTSAEIPASGHYSFITLTYQTGQNVTSNQNLAIKLINASPNDRGSQSHFDDVTLDESSTNSAVPEPASMLLFGIGGIATALLKKKKLA